MTPEEIERQLVSQFKWAKEQIDFGVRDDFKCRYCGQGLLDSVDAFRGWTLDHIVPKSKLDETAREDPENIALEEAKNERRAVGSAVERTTVTFVCLPDTVDPRGPKGK